MPGTELLTGEPTTGRLEVPAGAIRVMHTSTAEPAPLAPVYTAQLPCTVNERMPASQ